MLITLSLDQECVYGPCEFLRRIEKLDAQPENLLRLYDRFLTTGSPRRAGCTGRTA